MLIDRHSGEFCLLEIYQSFARRSNDIYKVTSILIPPEYNFTERTVQIYAYLRHTCRSILHSIFQEFAYEIR